MLVCESLDRFMMLNEDFLAENVLNEKIDINMIKDRTKKSAVLAALFVKFLLISGTTTPAEVKQLPPKPEIAQEPLIMRLAEDPNLNKQEMFNGFLNLWDEMKEEKKEERKIFSAAEPGFIDQVNKIVPGRLDTSQIARYDKYDDSILAAAENLKKKGEKVNPNLIKAMMIVETGMNPRKNSLGYEGFPQTKEHIINGWTNDSTGVFHPGINQRYGTNFTIKDMYNPEKAAEFMHYYMKAVSKSKHVKDLKDLIIAYNWGVGNLRKYKKGEKELPKESADYYAMVDTMKGFFPTS
jgi:hypothetical protein